MARKEREKHMVLYPGWSARDNYGKRKKAKEQFYSLITTVLQWSTIENWVIKLSQKENPTTGQMVEGNHHGYIRGITINNNYSTISTPY